MEISQNVFCFIGRFPVSTKPLQRRLKKAGARLASFEDEDATVVVLGFKAKSKESAARKRGLTVISVEELEVALGAPKP